MNAVIDTNILAVANFQADQTLMDCVENCIRFLMKIKENGGCVSVDFGGEIFNEYKKYASHAGQPGVGDVFFKWLYQNQGHAEICEFVKITPLLSRGFEEFPDDPALQNFDKSDRKFVAVACASTRNPQIFNATDSDWRNFASDFTRLGIPVKELC